MEATYFIDTTAADLVYRRDLVTGHTAFVMSNCEGCEAIWIPTDVSAFELANDVEEGTLRCIDEAELPQWVPMPFKLDRVIEKLEAAMAALPKER